MAESAESAGTVPRHLGLILDGNRRWARAKGLPAVEGHRRGYENLRQVALAASDRGVRYISAYVFSTENWERSQGEVDYLMELTVWVATQKIDELVQDGFRVIFLGSRQRLSAKVLSAIDSTELKTLEGRRAVLALCFNYGGQTELAEAVAQLVAGGVPAGEVTPERISEYLYHPEVPPLDLLIRTGGEQRLSGYMLWRASYAELYFTALLWPEFRTVDLDAALGDYANRQRRFGK